tara:strand:- start:330 stop:1133 length:804 start_codon:yes stop_codon:yes gene_type:complete
MRKVFLTIIVFCTTISISFYPKKINGNVTGSPGGKTNSPLDGSNCTGCHGGSINTGDGFLTISSNIPISGYIPGEIYSITATINETNSNKFGFELTSEANGSKTGQWIITNGNETKKTNNDNAVTHKIGGTAGNGNKSWTIDWQAPLFSSSTGTVEFYGVGMGTNNNGNNSGDNVYTSSYMVQEQQPSSIIEKEDIFNFSIQNKQLIINNYNKIKYLNIKDLNGKIIDEYHNFIPNKIKLSHYKTGVFIINISDYNNVNFTEKILIF